MQPRGSELADDLLRGEGAGVELEPDSERVLTESERIADLAQARALVSVARSQIGTPKPDNVLIDSDPYVQLIDALCALGDLSAAKELCEAVRYEDDDRPGGPYARVIALRLGEIELSSGNTEAGRALLEPIAKQEAGRGGSDRDRKGLREVFSRWVSGGDYTGAADAFKRYLIDDEELRHKLEGSKMRISTEIVVAALEANDPETVELFEFKKDSGSPASTLRNRMRLGVYYAGAGRITKALGCQDDMRAATRYFGVNSPLTLGLEAVMFAALENSSSAETHFRYALKGRAKQQDYGMIEQENADAREFRLLAREFHRVGAGELRSRAFRQAVVQAGQIRGNNERSQEYLEIGKLAVETGDKRLIEEMLTEVADLASLFEDHKIEPWERIPVVIGLARLQKKLGLDRESRQTLLDGAESVWAQREAFRQERREYSRSEDRDKDLPGVFSSIDLIARAQMELGYREDARSTLATARMNAVEFYYKADVREKILYRIWTAQSDIGDLRGADETAKLSPMDDFPDRTKELLIINLGRATMLASRHVDKTVDLDALKVLIPALPREKRREFYETCGAVCSGPELEELIVHAPAEEEEMARMSGLRGHARYYPNLSDEDRSKIAGTVREIGEAHMADPTSGSKTTLGLVADTLLVLETREAKDYLLRFAREAVDIEGESIRFKAGAAGFLDRLCDSKMQKGLELVYRVALHEETPHQLSRYLLGRLVSSGYLEKSLDDWLKSHPREKETVDAVKTVGRRGVVPSIEMLSFLVDRDGWEEADGTPIASIDRRIDRADEFRAEFEATQSADELRHVLAENEAKAMTYYIIYKGDSQFHHINNYTFGQFSELVQVTDRLEVHQGPLGELDEAMKKAGKKSRAREAVLTNLSAGRAPGATEESRHQYIDVRLDSDSSTQLAAINSEAREYFGSKQLGLCIKAPWYRRYLEEEGGREADELIESLNAATTPGDRATVIDRIEERYDDFRSRIRFALNGAWEKGAGRIMGDTSLEAVLFNESPELDLEQIIFRAEDHRRELLRTHQSVILALRNENEELRAVSRTIGRKRRACTELRKGLEHNEGLAERIEAIEEQVHQLEQRRQEILRQSVSDRFSGMDDDERRAAIAAGLEEIANDEEKGTSSVALSAFFDEETEKLLTETDRNLLEEVDSHVEGALVLVRDLTRLDVRGRSFTARSVRARVLDKQDDLMVMARFADSKPCCFSSSRYEMTVEHNRPNKVWVAAANKDPLTFVVGLDLPPDDSPLMAGRSGNENVGFVLGYYGVDEDGLPAVFLNGVYHSGGNDARSVQNILAAVESLVAEPVGARRIILAEQHGGSVAGELEGYSERGDDAAKIKRLRAIKDASGDDPETRLYDDLGKSVNTPKRYSGRLEKVLA